MMAKVTIETAKALSHMPQISRLGLAFEPPILTKATPIDTTDARAVHIWGYDGSGQSIAVGMPNKPDSKSCLMGAVIRGEVQTTSLGFKFN